MIRLLIALVLGAGVGSLLVTVLVDERITWVLIVSIFLLCAALPLLFIVHLTRSLASASPQQIEDAITAGRLGAARVDAIRLTGTTINDQPVCEIDLSVAPSDRSPYRTTIRQVVPAVQMPRVQPGLSVPVARIDADAPAVVILDRDLPDAAARTSRLPRREAVADWQAAPVVIGERPTLTTTAVASPRRTSIVPTGRRGRGWRVLAYILLFVVGFAATALPSSAELDRSIRQLVTGEDLSSMFAPGVLDEAMSALAEAAGTDQATSVSVGEEYVTADIATSDGATTYDSWMYRDGTATRQGPATIQPDSAETERFRLADVAWSAFPGMLERGLDRTGLDRDALENGPFVHVDRTGDMADGNEIRMTLTIGDGYTSHSLEATAEGVLIDDMRDANPALESLEKPDQDLFSSGLPAAIERLSAAAGSDETTSITLFETWLYLNLATAPGSGEFEDWEYEDRRVENTGWSAGTAFEDEVFRLSDVPWESIPALVEEAYERAGVERNGDGSPHVWIWRSPFEEGNPVVLSVYIPTERETIAVTFLADGTYLTQF